MTSIEKENKKKIIEKFHEIYLDLRADFEGKAPPSGVRKYKDGDNFRQDQECKQFDFENRSTLGQVFSPKNALRSA